VGFHGCVRAHKLLAPLDLRVALADARALTGIALPAIVANIATPVGNAIVTAAIAGYGDLAVAGFAVIGRVVPIAFGAIFSLSGSIGPILGQNFGAEKFDRVKRALTDSMIFIALYCGVMWLALLLLREEAVRVFGASGEGAALIRFFCIWIAPTWLFVGATFVANAAFNNLGFPTWSSVFNWGRATVGTVPFVWLGATQFGPEGVLAGQAAGATVFGIASIIVALRLVDRVAAHHITGQRDQTPEVAPPIPPFSTGKAATRARLGGPGTEGGMKSARREGRRARESEPSRGDEKGPDRDGRRGRSATPS